MKIYMDEKELNVSDSNQNIVQIAEAHGITMIAPCFRNKMKHGCCNACIVQVDGKQNFACTTKPRDGIVIVNKKDDLIALRKVLLEKYVTAIRNGERLACDCGCSDSKGSGCGCDDSGCC